MTTELLAQIWANPEDDAPRLVYADYLAERGDPRGELIQLQCHLAKTSDAAAKAREQELLQAHHEEWGAAFLAHHALVGFSRGFPHTILASGPHFLDVKHLIAREPIRQLRLFGDLKPVLRDLVDAPELARLHVLDLGNPDDPTKRLRDPGFIELCAADLSSLRELELGAHDLTVDSVRALAAAPWIGGLASLAIQGNPLRDVQVLTPKLNVTKLDLHDCAIEDPSGWAISKIPTLEGLRLSQSLVGPIAAEGLARIARLERLDLDDARLGDTGVTALAEGRLHRLTWLALAGNGIRDVGAIAIANSFDALEELRLADNAIGEPGAAALANSTVLRSLRELDLDGNLLGIPGIAALVAGTGLPALRRLAVRDNKLYTGEVQTFGDHEVLVTESMEQIRARFALKPHWTIA